MQNLKDFIVGFLKVYKLWVFKDFDRSRGDNCFYGLSIIQGAYKVQKADISELYGCKQVLHFGATISRDRY